MNDGAILQIRLADRLALDSDSRDAQGLGDKLDEDATGRAHKKLTGEGKRGVADSLDQDLRGQSGLLTHCKASIAGSKHITDHVSLCADQGNDHTGQRLSGVLVD